MTAAQISDARRNPVDSWTRLAVVICFVIFGPILAIAIPLDLLIRQPARKS